MDFEEDLIIEDGGQEYTTRRSMSLSMVTKSNTGDNLLITEEFKGFQEDMEAADGNGNTY